MLREAGPPDSGPPLVRVAGHAVTIRGVARRVEGGGVYGDVDLSQAGTVRLTLYDSLPKRPVRVPLPPDARFRLVVYEAVVGPLPAGAYEVEVGRFDPGERAVVRREPPWRVEIPAVAGAGDHR